MVEFLALCGEELIIFRIRVTRLVIAGGDLICRWNDQQSIRIRVGNPIPKHDIVIQRRTTLGCQRITFHRLHLQFDTDLSPCLCKKIGEARGSRIGAGPVHAEDQRIRSIWHFTDFVAVHILVTGIIKYLVCRVNVELIILDVAIEPLTCTGGDQRDSVGSHAARFLFEQGIKVCAIGDHTATLWNEKGIDIKAALDYAKANGNVLKGFTGGVEIKPAELLTANVDVLVPAALQNVITEEIAHNIKAKLIVEGANGPTTAEADHILQEKGIIVVPDILANGGGVTVSYFEWVQNNQGYYWSEDEVNAKHDASMSLAFESVWNNGQQYKTTMRIGAYITALKKVELGIKARGHY